METITKEIPVDQIVPDPDNPSHHSESSIKTMAKNIEKYDLIYPLKTWKTNGKYQLIDGDLRWRGVRRLNWKRVKSEVTEEKPSPSYIRGVRFSGNRLREFDWIAEAKETLGLFQVGMKITEIQELFGFSSSASVSTRIAVGELLEKLGVRFVEKIRVLTFKQVRTVARDIGVRRAVEHRKSIIPEEDVEIAKRVLNKTLEENLTYGEIKSELWRLKYKSLEQELEKEEAKIQEKQDKILQERKQELRKELEKEKDAEIKEEVEKIEDRYESKLDDAQSTIEALEAKLAEEDKQTAKDIERLDQLLRNAREDKEKLEKNLGREKRKIKKELENEYSGRLEKAIKSERGRIKREIEKTLQKQREAIEEEEERIKARQQQLKVEEKDIEAKRKTLEDKSVTARQVQKKIIEKIASLSQSLAGVDERYLGLLNPGEKIELGQELVKGTLDIERVILLIQQEEDVPDQKIEVKKLENSGVVDVDSD